MMSPTPDYETVSILVGSLTDHANNTAASDPEGAALSVQKAIDAGARWSWFTTEAFDAYMMYSAMGYLEGEGS